MKLVAKTNTNSITDNILSCIPVNKGENTFISLSMSDFLLMLREGRYLPYDNNRAGSGISPSMVKKIVKNFNPLFVGQIIMSAKPGESRLTVYDGNTRISAIEILSNLSDNKLKIKQGININIALYHPADAVTVYDMVNNGRPHSSTNVFSNSDFNVGLQTQQAMRAARGIQPSVFNSGCAKLVTNFLIIVEERMITNSYNSSYLKAHQKTNELRADSAHREKYTVSVTSVARVEKILEDYAKLLSRLQISNIGTADKRIALSVMSSKGFIIAYLLDKLSYGKAFKGISKIPDDKLFRRVYTRKDKLKLAVGHLSRTKTLDDTLITGISNLLIK